MEEKEKILSDNLKEYLGLAEEALKRDKFNSAVTLFFKAISAGADLFLLKKEGTVPSSHTNRFRILQEKYPELYDMLDKDFPFYQDSYTKKMDKEAAEVLKEDAHTIKKMAE
ncbi:MAG: hypothetical protein QF632_02950 [Candidatus Woesearchaeota archaeon]|jgi:hypothetical protein|nr:hypothetical protein [Candidatus Woesearchaeota archaeon]MDP7323694.1 hypothetical protein [Candidatus Woesearchaeota archaeon]MDP7457255.1 hypothetical protein [Candidatus Woesearchaeota archaeon]